MTDQLRYERIPKERLQDVWSFLVTEFKPDEPVMRSLDFFTEKDKSVLLEVIEKSLPYSFMAVNAGDELMGVMIGTIKEKNKLNWEPSIRWCTKVPSFLVPKQWRNWGWSQVLFDLIHYQPKEMFKELGHDRLFDGEFLCVSKAARGRGVGGELAKRSVQLAREENCGAYYAACSGLGSQAVFHRLNFEVLHEIKYEDFRNKKGEIVIWDHREHVSCKNMAIQL